MTARLLLARSADGADESGWTTTLRSCSAHEAYLRTYRRGVSASTAAEFLLLDRLFPRSVYGALAVAERCLAELDPRIDRMGTDRTGVDDEGRRRLGRLCAELEFLRVDEVLDRLPMLLARVQSECSAVHTAASDRYFRETRVIEWSV
jgi:uncharacterized alpha-E superfamily protein